MAKIFEKQKYFSESLEKKTRQSIIIIYIWKKEREGGKEGEGNEEVRREKEEKDGGESQFAF